MPKDNRNFRMFCLKGTGALVLVLMVCFCADTLAAFIRPRLKSNYVLAADAEKGEYIYKTDGFINYAGRLCDLLLGGDFTDAATVAGTISGNFAYDDEHPSYIEDMPLAEKKESQDVLEKTVSSGGGKTAAGDKITINNETSYKVSAEDTSSTPAFRLEKKGAQVMIVHSHTTESYATTERYNI